MWGALSLLMMLIKDFRDFRLLNVIALAGTGFTALYICVASGLHGFQPGAVRLAPYSFQTFFTGANVFLWAYGGHGITFEVGLPPLGPAHDMCLVLGCCAWMRYTHEPLLAPPCCLLQVCQQALQAFSPATSYVLHRLKRAQRFCSSSH